jgi:hypothetical protein
MHRRGWTRHLARPVCAVALTATSLFWIGQPSIPIIDASTPAITQLAANVTTATSSTFFSPPAASIIEAAFAVDSPGTSREV